MQDAKMCFHTLIIFLKRRIARINQANAFFGVLAKNNYKKKTWIENISKMSSVNNFHTSKVDEDFFIEREERERCKKYNFFPCIV